MEPLNRVGNTTLFFDEDHKIYVIYDWMTHNKKYYYNLKEAQQVFISLISKL